MAIAVTSEKLGQKATNNLLSPAYITNGLVFTSGQLGYDFEAQKFGVSVEEQTVSSFFAHKLVRRALCN